MPLTKTQIKHLRNLAHHLKPIVSIGQNGVTENVSNELDIALNYHELVKIKLGAGDREQRQIIIEQLATDTGAELIQAIGKTMTLFRRNAEKPKIQF